MSFLLLNTQLAVGDDDLIVDAEINQYVATYKVRTRGFTVGKIESAIVQSGNRFRVSTRTIPSRFVAFLTNSTFKDECQFELRNDGSVKPLSYVAKRTGSKSFVSSVKYDWTNGEIVYDDSTSSKMPKEYQLDNCNLYFAIATSNGVGPITKPLQVLDSNEHRSRGFKIVHTELETIDSAFGPLLTKKITLDRTDANQRRSIFWLSPKYPLTPVRVRDERNGKATVISLVDIREN